MTSKLIKKFPQLHLIELDTRLLPRLSHDYPHATIHHHDAVTFDYKILPGEKVCVVGNLPYEISSPLLFTLAGYEPMKAGYFMVQKEFAVRAVSDCGCKSFGRLSVMLQNIFEVTMDFDVPPSAFSPPPRVDSAMIHLVRREAPLTANIDALDVLCQAFSQKRKMLRQVFKGQDVPWEKLGIDPTDRAESISVQDYAAWANLDGLR